MSNRDAFKFYFVHGSHFVIQLLHIQGDELSPALPSAQEIKRLETSFITNLLWKSFSATIILQKQPFVNVLQNSCSLNFAKINRKTPVLESLFNEIAGLRNPILLKKRLKNCCFPVNFAKFLRITFLRNTFSGCFYNNTCYDLNQMDIILSD